MHERISKFISDCAAITTGRFVFVAYLVYVVSILGNAFGHFPFIAGEW